MTRDAAEAAFWAALRPAPLGVEEVALAHLAGRVLAQDVAAPVDAPPFDRAPVAGVAVRRSPARTNCTRSGGEASHPEGTTSRTSACVLSPAACSTPTCTIRRRTPLGQRNCAGAIDSATRGTMVIGRRSSPSPWSSERAVTGTTAVADAPAASRHVRATLVTGANGRPRTALGIASQRYITPFSECCR
ncbi:MAG: hypothetical protein ACO3BE_11285 [Gemmobacter sp.]